VREDNLYHDDENAGNVATINCKPMQTAADLPAGEKQTKQNMMTRADMQWFENRQWGLETGLAGAIFKEQRRQRRIFKQKTQQYLSPFSPLLPLRAQFGFPGLAGGRIWVCVANKKCQVCQNI